MVNGPTERLHAGDAQQSHLPTMLTLADGYRIYDPAVLLDPTYHVDASNGQIVTTRDGWHGWFIILFMLAVGVGGALLLGDGGVWSYALWAVPGWTVGFLVAAFIVDACSTHPERDYRKAHGAPPYLTVRRDDDLAYGLCELADEIAATRTWRDGVVDPDRTLGTTVWTAARRALGLGRLTERLRAETGRAAPDATLTGLREEIATTTTDLDHVRANLAEVAATARALDARIGFVSTGSLAVHGNRSVETDLAENLATHTRALRDLL